MLDMVKELSRLSRKKKKPWKTYSINKVIEEIIKERQNRGTWVAKLVSA